jgi:hypothetical protein
MLPAAGLSDQMTPWFDVPETDAVKAWVCEGVRVALPGVNATLMVVDTVEDWEIVKLVLVAEVSPGLVADIVYPIPAVLTIRLVKVAMPFWGTTVNVPARPVVLPERLSLTGFVADETRFPLTSSTATVTAGEIVAWVSAFVGCCRKASCVGGWFAVIVKVDEDTELCEAPITAIASMVDETAMESAPEYTGEDVVGTVPSVV